MSKQRYIVAHDEYMGMGPDIYEVEADSFRHLLEILNGVTDENRGDEFGEENKTIADFSTEELLETFEEANGDGQPYYLVWDCQENRKVIG